MLEFGSQSRESQPRRSARRRRRNSDPLPLPPPTNRGLEQPSPALNIRRRSPLLDNPNPSLLRRSSEGGNRETPTPEAPPPPRPTPPSRARARQRERAGAVPLRQPPETPSTPGNPVPSGKPENMPGTKPENLNPKPEKPADRPKPKTPPQTGRSRPNRTRSQGQNRFHLSGTAWIHAIRLLILGVGMGAIAGTALAVWNPGVRQSTTTAQITSPQQIMAVSMMGGAGAQVNVVTTLRSGREISALTPKIKALTQGHTDLVPGIFVSDLDSGDFYTLNGSNTFSAASMIKVPILIAFFQDVDAGKIRLDEVLTVEKGDVAGGSGDMQFDPVGSKHTALETARLMIVISDNTATNMLIRRMGGIEVLNHRFRSWGLQQTVIRDILPDLKGTNTTSPKELVSLLNAVSQGQLISMKSRDRALQIMRQTETDTLLPTSLGEGATIAHKTGDIGSLVGDTGLVDLPSGKRYIVTALVKRPHNDERAQELIRQMARVIYEHFDQGRSVSPQPQPQENQPQEDQPQSEEQSQ